MTILPIFICKANVGRSQIAEGIFNHIYGLGVAISIAGLEARKEKYIGAPDIGISDVLKEYKGVDISTQKIKYLKDMSIQELHCFNIVVFLFDPVKEGGCDEECRLGGATPYEYFKTLSIPIFINPVIDPFDLGKEGYKGIIDDIEKLIKELPTNAL
ncbi:hypothetical protein H7169_01015 [Candidatus Gracilibacteria bacterium]|nr:hypothetical protein [Candidatus Gracilibacteria bacterium]